MPSVTIPVLSVGHTPYPGSGGDHDGDSGRALGGGHPGGNPHGGPGGEPYGWDSGDDDDIASSQAESIAHSTAHGRRWRPTIKIDSPADYNGKDGPSTIPWLVAIERWLTLSQCRRRYGISIPRRG